MQASWATVMVLAVVLGITITMGMLISTSPALAPINSIATMEMAPFLTSPNRLVWVIHVGEPVVVLLITITMDTWICMWLIMLSFS